jgi:methionine-rich copper-binding protein CopC
MKSKKVLTILLALAMMVTFMPMTAFAGQSAADTHTGADWDEGTELTSATCADPYVVVEHKCTTEGCEASYKTLKATDHKWTKKEMSVVKIVEAAINQSATPLTTAQIDSLYAYYLNGGYCCANVFVCDECNKVDVVINANQRIRSTQDLGIGSDRTGYYVFPTTAAFSHSDPKPACAEKYVCEFCGQTVTNSDPDRANKHKWDDGVKVVKENVCGYTSVTTETCSECGETKVTKVPASTTGTHEGLPSPADPQPTTAAAQANYVYYNGTYYPSNYVAKKATCTAEGEGGLKCEKCGDILVGAGNGYCSVIPKVAHVIETKTYDATCSHPKMVVERCVNCNQTTTTSTGKALDHNYVINVIAEPTCYAPGITVVECTNCKAFATSVNAAALTPYDLNSASIVAKGTTPKTEDNLYFKGFTGELDGTEYMLIASWDQKNHDWGAYEDMSEATCTEPAKQAKKCSVCGLYNVHNTNSVGKALGHTVEEVVVPATCGTKGYTYKFCSTCEKYAPKAVKTGDTTTDISDNDVLTDALKYNWTDPKVKLGAECNFEWKVTKPATETTDGEKALVCSVCGTVKAGSETVIPADVATAEKKAAAEAALPVIEAAAEVINNAGTYKADGVDAVKEAKQMLNSAIASGTAADVKAMTELLQKATAAVEAKDANTVKAQKKTLKASATKNKTFKKAAKAKNAVGKVTFKKANKVGGSKIVVKSNGNVIVKKGLKKGTYKVKFTATAKGDGNTLKGSSSATIKVVVK